MPATARALMARPRLPMLDEPSWGLAPILVRRLYVLEWGGPVRQGNGEELFENPELKAAYLGV